LIIFLFAAPRKFADSHQKWGDNIIDQIIENSFDKLITKEEAGNVPKISSDIWGIFSLLHNAHNAARPSVNHAEAPSAPNAVRLLSNKPPTISKLRLSTVNPMISLFQSMYETQISPLLCPDSPIGLINFLRPHNFRNCPTPPQFEPCRSLYCHNALVE